MRPFLSRLPLLAALALTVSACDTTETIVQETRAVAVDFALDGDRYIVSQDTRVASFDIDDVVGSAARSNLRSALAQAGDGAIVVAYIKTSLVLDGSATSQTYSALPLTRAQDATVTLQSGEVIQFVDYSLSYEYSFDNEDFYFDVVSSARADGFTGGSRAFFDAVIPVNVDLRVVSIPANRFANARVDLRDYEAVRLAFDLPK